MTEDDLHGNRKYFWVNTEYGWTMKHLDQAGWWVDDMPSDEPQEGEEVVPVPAPARIEELERENERLLWVLEREIQTTNGCRLRDGSFHVQMRPVSENPCSADLGKCSCHAQLLAALKGETDG